MFTIRDMVDAIRELGVNYPDAVYGSDGNHDACTYHSGPVQNGPVDKDGVEQVGCIVGQAAAELGVPYAVLLARRNSGAGAFLDDLISRGLMEDSEHADDYNWIANVQEYQDRSTPWGEAVDNADLAE